MSDGGARVPDAYGGVVNNFPVVHGNPTVNNVIQPPPAALGAPHQTPAVDPCVYERTERLDELDEIVLNADAKSVRIIILSGTPGIGRRTTARQWAHRTALARLFGGGEVHIDFATYQDRDRPGTGVAAALADVLGALGADRQWPEVSIEALGARYRSLTFAREPVLVLLEGVTGAAQVRALTPSRPGSVVVVAGDQELGDLVALGGATLIRLEPLSAEASRTVLLCLCGDGRVEAAPAATDRLVELCGGLPLALRLAAARLRLEPHLTVAEYVAELENEADRLDGLTVTEDSKLAVQLDRVVERLPPSTQRIYLTLGSMPIRSVDARLVAVAGGVPPRQAAADLRMLRENSLVQQDEFGRYRFHDLVRLHARECVESDLAVSDPAGDVTRRIVEYVLPLAAFADRAVTGSRTRTYDYAALVAERDSPFATSADPKADALRWFEIERDNLMALLRAAARHGALDTECGQLAEMLTALFLNRRYLHDWIEAGRLGADAAARIGAGHLEARLRSMVSRPLCDLSDFEGARGELERALNLVELGDASVLRASVWEFYGRYLNLVRPEAAGEAYARALELNVVLGERRGEALVVFYLGENLERLDRPEEALETLERARAMFESEEMSDLRMGARAALTIGRVRARVGDIDGAVRILESAAKSLAAQGATYYEAQACGLLGGLLLDRGDREAGRAHLKRAVAIYAVAGDPKAADLRARLVV
jgi:tetratricopeptide (TPR) repeat protein